MAGVLDVLKQSGSVSLDELALRSTEAPDVVGKRVLELQKLGLVRIRGNVPTNAADVLQADQTMVELTAQALRAAS